LADLTAHRDHAICNYEGTSYRADFWDGRGREYEDLAERKALRQMLPPTGQRLLDLGAGFGRLADLYDGYQQVILLDYATSGLREAQARLGGSSRFVFVAADLYHLPFAPAICDTAVTVRVLHHLSDVPAVLRAIAGTLRPGGAYVLEYANKRNLKAILRYLLRRQTWSPFNVEPVEFVKLNYDFHPAWMARQLALAGVTVDAGRAVSHFRYPLLKRTVPPALLATADALVQVPSAAWKLSPSVFLKGHTAGEAPAAMETLFACPSCHSQHLVQGLAALTCGGCGAVWPVVDGIYDFRNAPTGN
jgi:SAM-dependent methyltransferase